MGPNDTQLVRVFTRKTGAVVANMAFPFHLAFEAIIECEAGTAIHATGARYEIKIDIVDFSAMTSIVRFAMVAAGSLGDAYWPTQAQQFVFPLAAPGVLNEGHVWKIFTSLKIGITNPHTSLAESDLFLITTP
jgi:hypothetical protein